MIKCRDLFDSFSIHTIHSHTAFTSEKWRSTAVYLSILKLWKKWKFSRVVLLTLLNFTIESQSWASFSSLENWHISTDKPLTTTVATSTTVTTAVLLHFYPIYQDHFNRRLPTFINFRLKTKLSMTVFSNVTFSRRYIEIKERSRKRQERGGDRVGERNQMLAV